MAGFSILEVKQSYDNIFNRNTRMKALYLRKEKKLLNKSQSLEKGKNSLEKLSLRLEKESSRLSIISRLNTNGNIITIMHKMIANQLTLKELMLDEQTRLANVEVELKKEMKQLTNCISNSYTRRASFDK